MNVYSKCPIVEQVYIRARLVPLFAPQHTHISSFILFLSLPLFFLSLYILNIESIKKEETMDAVISLTYPSIIFYPPLPLLQSLQLQHFPLKRKRRRRERKGKEKKEYGRERERKRHATFKR